MLLQHNIFQISYQRIKYQRIMEMLFLVDGERAV